MTVEVRELLPADRPAAHSVVARAFGGPRVADLVYAQLDSDAHRLALVAERERQLVGYVQLCRGWLDASERLVEVPVLSPLGVDPDHQGIGVGKALVRAVLAAAEADGAPLVFLEGEPDYYPPLGFERGRVRGFTPPSDRIPDAAFQVAVLPAYEPWMRGALVYPDVLWQQDAVGLRPGR